MDTIVPIIQGVVALGIYNVWLVRFGKSTSWRGGDNPGLRLEWDRDAMRFKNSDPATAMVRPAYREGYAFVI